MLCSWFGFEYFAFKFSCARQVRKTSLIFTRIHLFLTCLPHQQLFAFSSVLASHKMEADAKRDCFPACILLMCSNQTWWVPSSHSQLCMLQCILGSTFDFYVWTLHLLVNKVHLLSSTMPCHIMAFIKFPILNVYSCV